MEIYFRGNMALLPELNSRAGSLHSTGNSEEPSSKSEEAIRPSSPYWSQRRFLPPFFGHLYVLSFYVLIVLVFEVH